MARVLLVACALFANACNAFAPVASPATRAAVRVQSDGIKSVDLKSPNELTEEEYNSYSGAAIGGTLLMLIPVAYYDGLLFEFAKSFAISALLGGGLGAYLSLRKDGVGEKAGEFGSAVVNKVKEI